MLAVLTVDTPLDTIDFGDNLLSLREAIFVANTVAGADTIQFDSSLSGETILLAMGELVITDALTIDGFDAELLTIDAQDQSRIFKIDTVSEDTFDVTIIGLTLRGGESGSFQAGGAIYSPSVGTLTLERSVIVGNSSRNGGGGCLYLRQCRPRRQQRQRE